MNMNKIELIFFNKLVKNSEKVSTNSGEIIALNLSIDKIDEIINTNCEDYYSNITTDLRGNRCLNVYPYENGNFGEIEVIKDLLFYSNIQETNYSINQ